MRYLFFAFVACVAFTACNKDKYTSAPQIKFKSITSPFNSNSLYDKPVLIIELTDLEGDFGFKEGKDTSYVFVKNTRSPFRLDSFKFPSTLSKAIKKNFKGDVEIDLRGDGTAGSNALPGPPPAGFRRPYTDTVYYEVYVKDFAKHKSNVIKTSDPFLYITP